MHQLALYSDSPGSTLDLQHQFDGFCQLSCCSLRDISDRNPDLYTVIDTSLKDVSRLMELKDWLAKRPKGGKAIFVIDKASRIEEMRAFAIGATGVVHRPVKGRELLNQLWGEFGSLADSGGELRKDGAPGVVAALDALQDIFASACLGGQLDTESIQAAGEQVVSQIGEHGLGRWIDTVRKHHSQTYQHCLLVTGAAVAFGQHLGVGQGDRVRLSSAGLLHDIGKARIPLSILEKPGPLDQDELIVMRNHPQLGADALQAAALPPEMLDMVLHHHELLDGSGYPHALQASDISDLVRIMTISDIFGALIEKRSYKPPLSADAAYQILVDMGPKLDKDLVREFQAVAHSIRHH